MCRLSAYCHESVRETAKTLDAAKSFLETKKALMSSTSEGPENRGRRLKWMIAESFPFLGE